MASRKKDVVPVEVPDGFTMKDAARVLLLSAGLSAHITAADGSFRAGFERLFDATDNITGKTIPDAQGRSIDLGKVRMDGGGQTARVTDARRLLDWAAEHFPSAVVTREGEPSEGQVDRAATFLFDEVRSVGALAQTESAATWCRTVAEAMLTAALSTVHLHPSSEAAWLTALTNGETVKDDRGDDWTELPGVEVVDVAPKFVVTTNKATIDGVITDLLGGTGLLSIEGPKEPS